MEQLSIEGESFEKKVEEVGKVLSNENEMFVHKGSIGKIEGICARLYSIPCFAICDSCLKRMKIFLRVLLFGICIAAGVFLFYKVSPFFSAI
jgi:hypothetical protein